MSNYVQYYQRVIAQNRDGLKLVLGGTGLGKTSSIPEVILKSCTKKKFIYLANRVQLLNEMKENCSAFASDIYHVENDSDLILKAIEHNNLTDILNEPLVKKYITYINSKYPSKRIDIGRAIRDIYFLREHMDVIRVSSVEEYTRSRIALLFKNFKIIIQEAHNNRNSKPKHGFSQKDFSHISNLPAFKALFPYLHFKENPNAKLLLMTIQKAFFGFFDGSRNVSISTLEGQENGNYIIFLDEFDFLENDLINLISQDFEIADPFDFVSVFYQRMTKNKLPFEKYLASNEKFKEIKARIRKIEESIDSLNRDAKIPYPGINHFVCTDNKLKSTSVFQTNYSIVNKWIYLDDSTRENSFTLTSEKTNKSAFRLLDVVNNASKRIIRLFKDLEISHPDIYHEVLRQCFENTSYERLIPLIKQIGKRTSLQKTNYAEILANGYGLFEIEADVSLYTDPDEVKFNYYSINTTPEKILLHLCKNNLVFGLSATADISRVLRNFDLNWLKNQKIDNEKFFFFEFQNEDKEDIRKANLEKKNSRGNNIFFEEARPLQKGDKLLQFLEEHARQYPETFSPVEGKRKESRLNRVNLFFATLKWIIANHSTSGSLSTHLIFLSSYDQIRHIFDRARTNEDGLYEIVPIHNNKIFTFYEITIPDSSLTNKLQKFKVVFYNSNLGRNLNSVEELKTEYDKLFWSSDPVIVVTTYPSAGNGINLQYYSTEEGKRLKDKSQLKDFTHIHLLEGHYYYFSGYNDSRPSWENKGQIKQDIYGVSKLWGKKQISEGRLKELLRNIRHIDYFNPDYLSLKDGKLNQIAIFIQALGRIERVWSAMPDQFVRLSRDVYEVFEIFCTSNEFSEIKAQFEKHASNNLLSLFASILDKHKKNTDTIEDVKEDFLMTANRESIASVRKLLNEIEEYRNGADNSIDEKWHSIRIAVLKHDFENELIKALKATFQTEYFKDGKINLNDKLQVIPTDLWNSAFHSWDINMIYKPINENDFIRNSFKSKGYELEFSGTGKIFTPYFYQAFLSGALGEAAIEILLGKKGIRFEKLPRELFEIADLKVHGHRIYFDCKNFSERTIMNFSLSANDPLWHPKLNDDTFKATAVEKFNLISKFHNSQDCKLIYINFIGAKKRAPQFYDSNCKETDVNKSRIIVIQGVVEAGNNNDLCPHFSNYIQNLSDLINNEDHQTENIDKQFSYQQEN